MNYTSDELIYAVEKLLPYLSSKLQANLALLLDRASAGQQVDNLIVDLLSRDDIARRWMGQALLLSPLEITKSLEPLPGLPSSIQASSRWVCRQCGFEWVVLRAGRPVPPCPKDYSVLVQSQQQG